MPTPPVHTDMQQPPPMVRLLALLRESGFLATTDDYVDLLKIIERYGDEGLDSLAQRICPIIAMTPEEQTRFYNVFETYKNEQEDARVIIKPKPNRSGWWWLLLLPVVLILGAI